MLPDGSRFMERFAEVGLDKAFVTHMNHREWYRTYFYADAKDGWYRNTGDTVHFGISAGVAVGKAELLARSTRTPRGYSWRRSRNRAVSCS